jgi:hypothetical protein
MCRPLDRDDGGHVRPLDLIGVERRPLGALKVEWHDGNLALAQLLDSHADMPPERRGLAVAHQCDADP